MVKALIIGGGVAGLSAGIWARLNGIEAELFEAHSKLGGNLTGWDRRGCHIDNCIHWLTGTNKVTDTYRMWETLGVLGDGDVFQPDSLYTYLSKEGETLSLYRDIDRLKSELMRYSEQDEREITAFIGAVKAAKVIAGISAEENSRRASASELIRYAPRLLPYLNMTAGELSERFRSRVIRGFLRSLLGESFGAVALLFVFATFCSDNGGIPAGSSLAAAKRMEERFTGLGGIARCSSPAERIHIEDRRAVSVKLQNGREVQADYVILACEPACAFGKLLDKELMPRRIQRRYRDKRLKRFSSFHCAFLCDAEKLPFKGDMIIDLPEDLQREFVTQYLVLREFSHEKSFAPKGKSLMQTICFCGEEQCVRCIELSENKEEYRTYKNRLAERIAEAVVERFDGLRNRLECIDVWTPATYRRFTGSPTGSYMSFAFSSGVLPRFVGGRVKGVENLLLATQWQQAPGGLPSAAFAGKAAVKEILRLERKKARYGFEEQRDQIPVGAAEP